MFNGQISNILFVVVNNIVEFLVVLEEFNYFQLCFNMCLEIFVVIDGKVDVFKVCQGLVFKGGFCQKFFVVCGVEVYLLDVCMGISNGDYIEFFIDELKVGDKIIISDICDFEYIMIIKFN